MTASTITHHSMLVRPNKTFRTLYDVQHANKITMNKIEQHNLKHNNMRTNQQKMHINKHIYHTEENNWGQQFLNSVTLLTKLGIL